MNLLMPLQTIAQISVERILNALPEGFLIAFFAWGVLRVLRRQNSGTRFAVWFSALLTVAALPVLGGFGVGRTYPGAGTPSLISWAISSANSRPALTIPAAWALVLFIAWAIGAGVATLRLVAGLWRLRQLRASCTAVVAADLDPVVRATVDSISQAGSVTVATSERVRVPAAIGFWKGTIVLPAWAIRELPPADLNVILLHEFAHLRRGDDWTNLIQKIVRSLFFFHPAVWWIESRLSVEREMACDDAVLAETANPLGYATCLVSLLEKSMAQRASIHRGWSMAQAAVHRAREAALRLAQILDTNRPVATRVWKPALGMVSAFSLVCLMALPLTPQFVAFDSGRPANTVPAYTAISQASTESSLLRAMVIPAAFKTSEAPSTKKSAGNLKGQSKETTARLTSGHGASASELAAAPVGDVRMDATPPRDSVPVVRASSKSVPQFHTVVFVETTEYMTSNSTVWSVQVWRVMVLSPVTERSSGAAVTKSI